MRQDTRAKILEGAARAVRAGGIRDTTVQNILTEASVSRRTFYQHFSNKESVLLALYEDAMGGVMSQMRDASLSAPDPIRRITDAVDAYVEAQLRGGDLLIQLQAEAIRSESMLAPTRKRIIDGLVDFMDKGVRDVLGVSLDPLVYRGLFIGMGGLVIYLQSDGTFTEEDAERVRAVIGPMMLSVIAGAPRLPKRGDFVD